uniref:Uncharacterized protein n=1 Tax=Tritia obsoleta TaxID=1934733 RepID=D7EYK5_9CAEN|nr:hypothetical protein [Tritia obsoleta]
MADQASTVSYVTDSGTLTEQRHIRQIIIVLLGVFGTLAIMGIMWMVHRRWIAPFPEPRVAVAAGRGGAGVQMRMRERNYRVGRVAPR